MDLSQLTIPDTVTVHIEFPGIGKLYEDEEKKKPVEVDLYSPASDQAIAYKHKIQKEVFKKVGRKGIRAMSGEDSDEREVDRLMAFTAAVRNMVYNEKPVNLKNIRDIYSNPKYGWLTDQLLEKIASWDDFLA